MSRTLSVRSARTAAQVIAHRADAVAPRRLAVATRPSASSAARAARGARSACAIASASRRAAATTSSRGRSSIGPCSSRAGCVASARGCPRPTRRGVVGCGRAGVGGAGCPGCVPELSNATREHRSRWIAASATDLIGEDVACGNRWGISLGISTTSAAAAARRVGSDTCPAPARPVGLNRRGRKAIRRLPRVPSVLPNRSLDRLRRGPRQLRPGGIRVLTTCGLEAGRNRSPVSDTPIPVSR